MLNQQCLAVIYKPYLVLSTFLVNLEVGSVITKGQFVFFDVLVENVTT